MEQANLETKPSLSLRRHYPVAPEKVWRAWTDPEAVKRWWGPGAAPLDRARPLPLAATLDKILRLFDTKPHG